MFADNNHSSSESADEDTTYGQGGGNRSVKAGVFGATGTTGVELTNLLNNHPLVQLAFGTSRELAGQALADTDPAAPDLILTHPNEAKKMAVDVAFLCLPHGASAALAAELFEQGTPVIDLSGDLRLKDEETHRDAYGTPRNEEIARSAVYGLPELERAKIKDARLITNPGCYPTAVGMAVLPLAERRLLEGFVYVDAKSGVSGAGRAPTATTHFCSANEDVQPYKVGRTHRHVPEMEQTIRQASDGKECRVVFCPHLVPIERGMLATCLITGTGLTAEQARNLYAERYLKEPFVKVLPPDGLARIRAAAYSNRAVIGISDAPDCDALIITSAIDNLGKGAAGQAVQNMNIMFDLPEAIGLRGF